MVAEREGDRDRLMETLTSDSAIQRWSSAWHAYQDWVKSSILGADLSHSSLRNCVRVLSESGSSSTILPFFLDSVQKAFQSIYIPQFWSNFEPFYPMVSTTNVEIQKKKSQQKKLQKVLSCALLQLCGQKSWLEYQVCTLVHTLENPLFNPAEGDVSIPDHVHNQQAVVFSTELQSPALKGILQQLRFNFQTWMVGSAPASFSELLQFYFSSKLDDLDIVIRKKSEEYVNDFEGPEEEEESNEVEVEKEEESTLHSEGNKYFGITEFEENRKSLDGNEKNFFNKNLWFEYLEFQNRKINERNSGKHSANEAVDAVDDGGGGDDGTGKERGTNVSERSFEWRKELVMVIEAMFYLNLFSMAEKAYSNELINKLKTKLSEFGELGYETSALPLIFEWIEALSLHFLPLLLPFEVKHAKMNANSSDKFDFGNASTPLVFSSNFFSSSALSNARSIHLDHTESEIFSKWSSQFRLFAYEILCHLRIHQLFDIVVDYPESMAAIEDIKVCLKHTQLERHLISSFCNDLNRRLLSPGAATSDILHHYISTIKCLKVIDTKGIVLENVIPLVSSYLHTRKDTIRCLVSMLTEEPHGDSGESLNDGSNAQLSLLEELEGSHEDSLQQENENEESEDLEGGEGEEAFQASQQWTPAPIESDPRRSLFHSRNIDVVRILVSDMFGSNEPFIEEYKNVLAEKLLAKTNYETDQEIRILELLKIRFGESNLQNCEVMIKDMADSKRTNANIRMEASKPSPVSLSLPNASPSDSLPLFSANSNLLAATDSESTLNGHVSTRLQPSSPDIDVALPERLSFSFEVISSEGEGDRDRTFTSSEGRRSADIEENREVQVNQREGTSVESVNGSWQHEADDFRSRNIQQSEENESPATEIFDARQDGSSALNSFTATIISSLFWPKLPEEKFNLPSTVENWMKVYSDHYHSIKAPRKLQWKPNLGRVKLDLEFADRKVEFNVSPVQASLISVFHEKSSLLTQEIAALSGIPSHAISRKIAFWVSQGVLKEDIDQETSEKRYTVIEFTDDAENRGSSGEEIDNKKISGGKVEEEEAEMDDTDSTLDERRNQEFSVIESYVIGMLTTFDSLPVERIHNMLKMFMVDPPYDKSIQQLQILMAKLIAEEKLEFVNNVYKKR